ncbi:hypothetical protein PX690_21525 [Bacillus velezensis]|uniref:hypothetical protein n=1 Tax=Bacillus velezensis TaxID=492670 RepID=UPI0023E18D96|nr:hypothetical protein [Bacillus velezensis]WES02049.1 hypothetical protein PX690_21525 [Bacillus velezensis]
MNSRENAHSQYFKQKIVHALGVVDPRTNPKPLPPEINTKHTLHPSHNFFTELLTFMPLTCSAPFPLALKLALSFTLSIKANVGLFAICIEAKHLAPANCVLWTRATRATIVTHKDIGWLSDAGVRGSVSTVCHGTFHSQPATLILFSFIFRSGDHGFRFKNANVKIDFSRYESPSSSTSASSSTPTWTMSRRRSSTRLFLSPRIRVIKNIFGVNRNGQITSTKERSWLAQDWWTRWTLS